MRILTNCTCHYRHRIAGTECFATYVLIGYNKIKQQIVPLLKNTYWLKSGVTMKKR